MCTASTLNVLQEMFLFPIASKANISTATDKGELINLINLTVIFILKDSNNDTAQKSDTVRFYKCGCASRSETLCAKCFH